jgi:hypothetical protein
LLLPVPLVVPSSAGHVATAASEQADHGVALYKQTGVLNPQLQASSDESLTGHYGGKPGTGFLAVILTPVLLGASFGHEIVLRARKLVEINAEAEQPLGFQSGAWHSVL